MVNLVGAITADVHTLMITEVFSARLLHAPETRRWIGIVSSLIIIPLVYLFIMGLRTDRGGIYFVWLILMFLFAITELIIDGILRIDFRNTKWAVITYVIFFFAATGGMIGVASQAGKAWSIATSLVFLIMAILVFVQRKITGF